MGLRGKEQWKSDSLYILGGCARTIWSRTQMKLEITTLFFYSKSTHFQAPVTSTTTTSISTPANTRHLDTFITIFTSKQQQQRTMHFFLSFFFFLIFITTNDYYLQTTTTISDHHHPTTKTSVPTTSSTHQNATTTATTTWDGEQRRGGLETPTRWVFFTIITIFLLTNDLLNASPRACYHLSPLIGGLSLDHTGHTRHQRVVTTRWLLFFASTSTITTVSLAVVIKYKF